MISLRVLCAAIACAAMACATPSLDGFFDDGGFLEEDGGATSDEDGGALDEDGGAAADGGAALDGGPRTDGGVVRDAGVAADGGVRMDGGTSDGGASDAGTSDGGASGCETPVGGTRCGATKVFEVTESGPSAFDFAAGRAMFLASEVSSAQGDFYVFSTELAPQSPGAATDVAFVSTRDSAASGGARGVFRQTGIANLSAQDGGPRDPATFTTIPAALSFREATRGPSNRVLARQGDIYALQLNLDMDGGASTYAAMVVDRLATPAGDGGATRQFVELRWLWQSQPNRRTFDRTFPPR